MRYIVGIDEAGRGPLAGPVAVSAVLVDRDFNAKKFFKGIRDSKKLSRGDREMWFRFAQEEKRFGRIDYSVSLIRETVIDRKGIVYAIQLGVNRCLKKLSVEQDKVQVFLDGALYAPEEFTHQTTIIKGDEKVPVISLASIIAKVTRDNRMLQYAKKFPEYGFEANKGYGTHKHRKSLKKFGPTRIHRYSFLNRIPH